MLVTCTACQDESVGLYCACRIDVSAPLTKSGCPHSAFTAITFPVSFAITLKMTEPEMPNGLASAKYFGGGELRVFPLIKPAIARFAAEFFAVSS